MGHVLQPRTDLKHTTIADGGCQSRLRSLESLALRSGGGTLLPRSAPGPGAFASKTRPCRTPRAFVVKALLKARCGAVRRVRAGRQVCERSRQFEAACGGLIQPFSAPRDSAPRVCHGDGLGSHAPGQVQTCVFRRSECGQDQHHHAVHVRQIRHDLPSESWPGEEAGAGHSCLMLPLQRRAAPPPLFRLPSASIFCPRPCTWRTEPSACSFGERAAGCGCSGC